MNDYISAFSSYNAERLERLEEYKKETNRKIIGYFCTQTPEEVMYAAGALPIRIMGNDASSVEDADSVLQTYVCSFARSCVDLMLKGNYSFLDGMVVPHSCDTIRAIYGVIKRNVALDFKHLLKYPIILSTPEGKRLVMEEHKALLDALANYTGKKITDQDLKAAIAIYNKNRELLRKLSALRLPNNRRISGSEFHEVVLAGFVMDKKDHNAMLEKLLKDLEDRKPLAPGNANILLAGNVVDSSGIIKLIEGLGADIVRDDLCTGTRYFNGVVDEKKAPMEAIADQYLERTYCPCKGQVTRRIKYLQGMAKAADAQGVIILQQKFCDPHLWDVPLLKGALDKNGMPVLMIEFEQQVGIAEGIKTRIQSLLEMMGR